jgi:hypothetical protein
MDSEDFLKSKLSAEDWKTYCMMMRKAKDKRMMDADDPDDPQSTLNGPPGRPYALDSRRGGMSMYTAAIAVEDRVMRRLRELNQAKRETGMAFDGDTPEAVYRAAIVSPGVSYNEIAGLPVSALKVVLKNVPAPGSRSRRSAMAFDSAATARLDEILGGVPMPVDLSA